VLGEACIAPGEWVGALCLCEGACLWERPSTASSTTRTTGSTTCLSTRLWHLVVARDSPKVSAHSPGDPHAARVRVRLESTPRGDPLEGFGEGRPGRRQPTVAPPPPPRAAIEQGRTPLALDVAGDNTSAWTELLLPP
jgi:hypothetical protein